MGEPEETEGEEGEGGTGAAAGAGAGGEGDGGFPEPRGRGGAAAAAAAGGSGLQKRATFSRGLSFAGAAGGGPKPMLTRQWSRPSSELEGDRGGSSEGGRLAVSRPPLAFLRRSGSFVKQKKEAAGEGEEKSTERERITMEV